MIDIDKETQAFEQWFSAGDHNGCGIEIWLAAKRHAAQVAETAPSGASVDSVARSAARYEHVRKLHPTDFAMLYSRNLAGEGAFDDLVDAAMSPTKAGEGES